MVKNLPSNAGAAGLIPGGKLRSHAPGNNLNSSNTNGEPMHCNEDPAQPRFFNLKTKKAKKKQMKADPRVLGHEIQKSIP